MFDYALFGAVLRSEIEIPELAPATCTHPRWRLTIARGRPNQADAEHLGSDAVTGEVRVNMYRTPDGFRLAFDDTGCFDVVDAGRHIVWYRPADVSLADARADLTGRVLATALHAVGTICLHASAVVLDGSAIGLIAPKLHGKSTLALALVASGARLLTDDTLPVEPGVPAIAAPGLHATRLWADSAARVGLGEAHETAEGGKQLFSRLPRETVTHDPAPLSALYLLVPMREPRNGSAAWRKRLSATESALVMIAHSKLAPLMGQSEAAAAFRGAAGLAAQIPMYRLNVVRDLDLLAEVVATIRSWHGAAAQAHDQALVPA